MTDVIIDDGCSGSHGSCSLTCWALLGSPHKDGGLRSEHTHLVTTPFQGQVEQHNTSNDDCAQSLHLQLQ